MGAEVREMARLSRSPRGLDFMLSWAAAAANLEQRIL